MNLIDELKIDKYINAHDTYTVYGGSRMLPEVMRAMADVSRCFVNLEEFQRKLGTEVARITQNEGAFLTNGAAGALMLSAAVCMVGSDIQAYRRLPDTSGLKNEIVMLRSQRNDYDAAISATGAKIVEAEASDAATAYKLRDTINKKTAAVFYFTASFLSQGTLPLEHVIRIAREKEVPVVVDAAANLPPAENLWNITKAGADLVIFSGGKTLCGPQDSGMILGRGNLIEDCIRFGAPSHGICRASKTSKEAMAGLYVAVKRYIELDHDKNIRRLTETNLRLEKALKAIGLETGISNCGPAGQQYPLLFGYCKSIGQAKSIIGEMRDRYIYVGLDERLQAIYISPLNLTDPEVEQVETALLQLSMQK